MADNTPLLRVTGLRTYFYTLDGVLRAVDGVDQHGTAREQCAVQVGVEDHGARERRAAERSTPLRPFS